MALPRAVAARALPAQHSRAWSIAAVPTRLSGAAGGRLYSIQAGCSARPGLSSVAVNWQMHNMPARLQQWGHRTDRRVKGLACSIPGDTAALP